SRGPRGRSARRGSRRPVPRGRPGSAPWVPPVRVAVESHRCALRSFLAHPALTRLRPCSPPDDGENICHVEFGVLGPLEVLDDGRQIELPRAKQRALLVALLLHRGETVCADPLIQELWGETPPRAAKGALQNLVAQLRQILGRDLIV